MLIWRKFKMKIYTQGSAAWVRQQVTQRQQREAAARPKQQRDMHGQKYLHPERRRNRT